MYARRLPDHVVSQIYPLGAMRTPDADGNDPTLTEKVERRLALGSLARLARFRARREQGYGWPSSLVLGRWRWLQTRWRALMYLWISGLGTILILLPMPDPDFGPFKEPETARAFLQTLWQVEAAALALSLAIIVFAVQAYRSSTHERYGGTLRRYIRASLLQESYELGVVALLLTAVVLLGAGHGGPAGSAGAVAVAVSLASMFVLPLLLTRALHTTHRDFLREERESRLTAAVRDQVDHEVAARIGLVLLNGLAATEPLELALFGGGRGGSPLNAIPAGAAGAVADININRLIRLARRARAAGGLTLCTRLHDYVGAESRVLLLPDAAHPRDTKLARRIVAVKPGRRRDETLSQYLDDLEEEAVAAIRSGGPATFQAVADAYMETLMEFPRSWQRYGQQYSTAVAQGIEIFPRGPVDTIRQQFYTNLVEALRAGSDEVLLTAAYLPISACTRALQYRADGLLTKMLGLSTAFLVAAWAHGNDRSSLLEDRLPRYLVEFTRYYLQPQLEEGGVADRLRFGAYVRLVYAQFGAMLKLGVDRGQLVFIRRVDGDWGTLLEHWEVDAFSPHPASIPRLEEEAREGDSGAVQRLAEARANAQLVELHTELSDLRTLLRFGLALWAWRQQPKSWDESFAYFSTQMGGVDQLVRITTKAVSAEFHDQVPWSNWILDTLQEGRAHAIPGAEAVIETFIAAALRAITPGEQGPVLAPAEWMPVYLDHAREVLAGAVSDPRNSDLPDVAARADTVRVALEAAAEAWRHQERLSTIEAPLAPEKVAEFCAHARTALEKARVVPDLLRLGNVVTALDTPPDDPPLIQSQVHKALFVANSRMIGAEMVAGDVGRQVTHLELRKLVQPMEEANVREIVADDSGSEAPSDFVEQLRLLVVRAVQRAESGRITVLIPIQWQLSQALGLAFLGGATPPEDWALSEGTAQGYAGVFEGVPVFQFPEVPDDVLYIVDLSRYVKAESWQPAEETAVAITVVDEVQARERAQHDPGRDQIGEDEIVRRWRETALITVDPAMRLSDDRDASAVTAIRLPASLIRDAG